jgi:hypothetical protein
VPFAPHQDDHLGYSHFVIVNTQVLALASNRSAGLAHHQLTPSENTPREIAKPTVRRVEWSQHRTTLLGGSVESTDTLAERSVHSSQQHCDRHHVAFSAPVWPRA